MLTIEDGCLRAGVGHFSARCLPLLAGRDDRGWSDAQHESEQSARRRQQKDSGEPWMTNGSPNADPQGGVHGSNMEPVESQIIFYLSGTWYNATARRIDEQVSTRWRSTDRQLAPDRTRGANVNFKSASSNSVDLKLLSNCLCARSKPLFVSQIRS